MNIEELIKESEEITTLERAHAAEYAKLSYLDKLAQKRGFKNHNDYQNNCKHISGRCQPMSKNKDCSSYLGVYVAEKVLSKVFENVQRMPYGNTGYDFSCKNDFKIDVKCACLCYNRGYYSWTFHIKHNKIADYFLLLSFDNRIDLNPQNVWLIKGTELIVNQSGSTTLNEKTSLVILNSVYSISKYKRYEQIDKIENLIDCCDSIYSRGII